MIGAKLSAQYYPGRLVQYNAAPREKPSPPWYRVVQVVSYPFDASDVDVPERFSVNVRNVPGHPTTMTQLEVYPAIDRNGDYRLLLLDAKRRYVHYAHASGRMGFPVDMLRYDACFPYDYAFEPYRRTPRGDLHPRLVGESVLIVQVSDRAKPRWTQERWRSFLWSIEPLPELRQEISAKGI